jgi:hypothetical protein
LNYLINNRTKILNINRIRSITEKGRSIITIIEIFFFIPRLRLVAVVEILLLTL